MPTLEEVRQQAKAALAAGDHQQAVALAHLIRRHFPEDYQTQRLLGRAYLGTYQLGRAEGAFRAVLDVDPEDAVAWSALGIIAEEKGDLADALDALQRALDVDFDNREIAEELARLRSQSRHTRPAGPLSSVHSTARRFLKEGSYESAIPWLQDALRLEPGAAEVAVALARALWLSARPREAEAVAREVLVEHPNCLIALGIVAGSAISTRGEDASPVLARTAALNPGNGVARDLFAQAGLDFPEREEELEIPDAEVQAVLERREQRRPAAPAPQVESQPGSVGAFVWEEGAPPTGGQSPPADVPPVRCAREEESSSRIASAEGYSQIGLVGLAVSEYREALRLGPSVAPRVAEAVLAMADANPDSLEARWLAGDALALSGRYRMAVEQYLRALKGAERAPS